MEFLKNLDKVPVFYAGDRSASLLAICSRRGGSRMPLALLVIGLGTFVLVGVAGLSVIDRYLLVPVADGHGLRRASRSAAGRCCAPGARAHGSGPSASVALVVYGVVFTATRVNLTTFDQRADASAATRTRSLRALLDDPKVRAGLRCGPVSTPNHKLIPDTRWLLDAPRRQGHRPQRRAASARASAAAWRSTRSTASSLLRSGFTVGDESTQDTFNSVPMPASAGGVTPYYSAYVRC